MRVLVSVTAGVLRLESRNENDVTVSFPELAGLADRSVVGGHDIVLDGEVVAFDDSGVPRFGALADRIHVKNARRAEELAAARPVTLMVFDLLALDGLDVTGAAVVGPPRRPGGAGAPGPPLAGPADVRRRGGALRGDPGPGARGRRQQAPVLGLPARAALEGLAEVPAPPVRVVRRRGLAARDRSAGTGSGRVLVGEPTAEGLVFRGRVGSGLAGKAGERLAPLLAPLAADASPFVDPVPREDAVGARWVRPEVVVEVGVARVHAAAAAAAAGVPRAAHRPHRRRPARRPVARRRTDDG